MARVHRVVSLLKRWMLGTHQGAVAQEHLEDYLNEFTLRFNRRKESRSGSWLVIIHVGFSIGSVFHQNQIGGSAEYESLTVVPDLTWADLPVRVHEFHVGPLLYHRKDVGLNRFAVCGETNCEA